MKTLVFGAFAEASDGVHLLIQQIAEARMRFQGLQRGREGQKEELGVLIGMVRRRLRVAAAKVQVQLLNRMEAVKGNPMAAQYQDALGERSKLDLKSKWGAGDKKRK